MSSRYDLMRYNALSTYFAVAFWGMIWGVIGVLMWDWNGLQLVENMGLFMFGYLILRHITKTI